MTPSFCRCARAVLIATLILPTAAGAQIRTAQSNWVGSMRDDYDRLMQLTGARPLSSRMIRPLVLEPRAQNDSSAGAARDPWRWLGAGDSTAPRRVAVTLYDPALRLTHNSAVPFGGNDGPLWSGRGLNGLLELGAVVQAGPFTAQLAPSFTWSANQEFELGRGHPITAAMYPYADVWLPWAIDRPQRFGEEPTSRVVPGQSYVRADWFGAAIGVSTASMWWGPGVENSLLMSNNAAGYPHFFAGTSRPVDLWLGHAEAVFTAGSLTDSDFWRSDSQPHRDRRRVSSVVATFNPRGAPGLYIGGARTFMQLAQGSGLRVGDLSLAFQGFWKKNLTGFDAGGADNTDQLVSLFGRWVFPSAGLEVYTEWGRTDHSWDARDFLLEPDHASASIVGLRKVFLQSGGFLVLGTELTNLEAKRDAQFRSSLSWYAHGRLTQGYTNDGQILGSAIGPGSSQQFVTLDAYRRWGRIGIRAERIRRDTDALYARFRYPPPETYAFTYHDVSTGVGLNGVAFAGPVTVSLAVTRYVERNRYSILNNDLRNLHVNVRGEWQLPR